MGKGYWTLRKGNPNTFLFSRNRLYSGSVNYGVFISSLDWQLLKNWELLRTSMVSLSGWSLYLPSLSIVPFIHGACMKCPLPRTVADTGIISQEPVWIFLAGLGANSKRGRLMLCEDVSNTWRKMEDWTGGLGVLEAACYVKKEARQAFSQSCLLSMHLEVGRCSSYGWYCSVVPFSSVICSSVVSHSRPSSQAGFEFILCN